jgi:hypothetical protein
MNMETNRTAEKHGQYEDQQRNMVKIMVNMETNRDKVNTAERQREDGVQREIRR